MTGMRNDECQYGNVVTDDEFPFDKGRIFYNQQQQQQKHTHTHLNEK